MLRGIFFRILESAFAVFVALVRQRLSLIIIDTRMERGAHCEICRVMQSGCSPLKLRFPVLHLIFSSGEIVADGDAFLRMRRSSLHWPIGVSSHAGCDTRCCATGQSRRHRQRPRLTWAPTVSYQVVFQGIVLQWSNSAEYLFGWHASGTMGNFLPIVDAAHRNAFLSKLPSFLRGHLPANKTEHERGAS